MKKPIISKKKNEEHVHYHDHNVLPVRNHGRSTLRTLNGAYSLLMSKAHVEDRKKIKLDPYSDLIPPQEGPNRRVFLWSYRRKTYTIQKFQQLSSILTVKEIKDVFSAVKPHAAKVLDGKKCNPSNFFFNF